MTGYHFRPAESFTDRHGLFVALVGGTNSGKTFSALRLAQGIAGKDGKVAVLDTEGGRTLHLKSAFRFDAMVLEPPFRPERFADAAKVAEDAGYGCLLIDSFSMEWAGVGGVLEWQQAELAAGVERQRKAASSKGWAFDEARAANAHKASSWIVPKMAHKAMVYSFLQRRMPIIFSIRGEETFDPETKKAIFKSVCNKAFPFEVTVSFRLASDRKGIIDLSDSSSWKMEGAHQAIFRHGEQLSEHHGNALAVWASGGAQPAPSGAIINDARVVADGESQPHHVPVPINAEGSGSDWKLWATHLMPKRLRTCRDAAEIEAVVKANADSLDGLKQVSPDKAYAALEKLWTKTAAMLIEREPGSSVDSY